MSPSVRFLGLVGVFVLGIIATAWLSNSFKASDVRHAIGYIQTYKGTAQDAMQLGDYIIKKHNIASSAPQPVWGAYTENSFYGVMIVKCTVISASPAVEYRWKAGVVDSIIMPDNPQATELMNNYDKEYNRKK